MKIFRNDENARICFIPAEGPVNEKRKGKKVYVRPAEKGMLLYLNYMINVARFFKRRTLLICDGERCFRTPLVNSFLEENGIFMMVITPSVLHQLINPCDNDFHSVFKSKFYRVISNRNEPTISVKEKLLLAKDCYENISSLSIKNMFVKCGLTDLDENKTDVLAKLVSEGIKCLGKNEEYHRKNLICYLKWCVENHHEDLCSSLTRPMMKFFGLV